MESLTFHETIRQRREQLHLTQKDIADAIGVDVPMYSRIEKGTRPIKEDAISILASILQFDLPNLRKLWLADKVISVVNEETDAAEILSYAAQKVSEIKPNGCEI